MYSRGVTLMITLLMWRAIRGRYLETTEVCTLEGWTLYRSFAPGHGENLAMALE